MMNVEGVEVCRITSLHSAFILLHSLFVPVVERRPREPAKLEVQVRFLAGAVWEGEVVDGWRGGVWN